METRDNPLGSITYGGDALFVTPRRASNDLKSLDERFEELLDAYAFWKFMPSSRIRRMDLAQRIVLRDMRARVSRFEQESGVIL